MTPRVIIPEVVGEGGRGHRSRRPDPHRPQPPAVGVGAMLKALAAGVVLVTAVSAILVLGFTFMIIFAAVFSLIWLVSLIRGKLHGDRSSVVVRSTRTDGPMGSTIFIERFDSHHEPGDGGDRPE